MIVGSLVVPEPVRTLGYRHLLDLPLETGNASASSRTRVLPSVRVLKTAISCLAFLTLVPVLHAAPAISSISPTSGTVGTSVTIYGSGFGSSQGQSTVKFNGTGGTPTSWISTRIIVPVPTNATSGTIVVTVSGVASNGASFNVTPNITSLSPSSGLVGTSITISGSGFGATQATSTVAFNNTNATP